MMRVQKDAEDMIRCRSTILPPSSDEEYTPSTKKPRQKPKVKSRPYQKQKSLKCKSYEPSLSEMSTWTLIREESRQQKALNKARSQSQRRNQSCSTEQNESHLALRQESHPMLPKPVAPGLPTAVKLITPDCRVSRHLPHAPKRAEGRMPRVDETYRNDGLLINSHDFVQGTVEKILAKKRDNQAINIFVNIENVEEKIAEMKRLETQINEMEMKSLQQETFKQIFSRLLTKNI